MHKKESRFPVLFIIALFFFWGSSFAVDYDSPFIKDDATLELMDPVDAGDPLDPVDEVDSNDPEDPRDSLDSLSQDTPDTEESVLVHQVEKRDSVVVKKNRRDYYLAVHNELSVVGSDIIRETPFMGAYFASGYSYEKFVYKLSTVYAMAFLTGANLGVIYGFSEYEEKLYAVDDPYLDVRVKLFVSTPFTVESMLDFFFWRFLYDFGFEVDWFFWEYRNRSNKFHEFSDYWYGLRPAVYGVFGAGDTYNLFGHRVELVFRTSYALFGYHIGKKREFRSGVSTNVWF